MRNHALAAAFGVLTAAIFVPCSQSQAAGSDPTGYWYKPDAERESKIQVFKCGRDKLCAKIVWLKNPKDSAGKALHDLRNENPSMRDRPIVGLPLFSGMTQSAPATWSGQIYNPEDGHTYSATLTLMSRSEIKLRGCKAWLLCGEKQWLRTSAPEVLTPAAPAEDTEQIEASAEPSSAPAHAVAPAVPSSPGAPAIARAEAAKPANAESASAAAPGPVATGEAQAMAEPQGTPAAQATAVVSKAEIAAPASPPTQQNPQAGYGFLSVSTNPDAAETVSGENVSSMIDMTKPIASAPAALAPAANPVVTAAAKPAPADAASAQSGAQTASQAEDPVPLPAQKPKVKPKPIATASAAKAAVKPEAQAAPPAQAAPAPQEETTAEADPNAQGTDVPPPAAAEASMAEGPPLTRRQLRKLRRQQMQQEEPFLPWLRSSN